MKIFTKNRKNELVCGALLLTLAGCSSIGSSWDNTVDFIFGPDEEASQRQEKAAELAAEAASSKKPEQAVLENLAEEKVDKLANELASLAPETMQFGLEAFEKQDSKSFDEALPYLKEQITKCFEGKDAKEGISAFLEKRKPNWD